MKFESYHKSLQKFQNVLELCGKFFYASLTGFMHFEEFYVTLKALQIRLKCFANVLMIC